MKRTLILLFLAFSFCSVAQNFDALMKMAEEENDPARKIDFYTQAIGKKSKHAEAYTGRAASYLSTGQIENAVEDCRTALKLNPRDATGYVIMADANMMLGFDDLALSNCDDALRINPAFPQAMFMRAQIYARKANHAAALSDFESVLQTETTNLKAQFGRALSLAAMNRDDEALSATDAVLTIDPDYAPALGLKARLNYVAKDFEAAAAAARKALQADSGVSLGYIVLTDCEIRKSNWSKALKYGLQALRYDSLNARLWAKVAEASMKTGNSRDALAKIDRAIELDPKNADSYCLRASLKHQYGRINEATSDYDKAIMLEPSKESYLIAAGKYQELLGKYEKAIEYYRQASNVNPENPEPAASSAMCQARLGMLDEAVETANKSLSISSRTGSGYLSRGFANLAKGNDSDAANDLQQAVKANSKPELALFYLALAKYKQQDTAMAMQLVNQCIEYKATMATAWALRSLLNSKIGNAEDAEVDLGRAREFERNISGPAEREDYEQLMNELTSVQSATATATPLADPNKSRKVALVIGVKSYVTVPPLVNTINDAMDMSRLLRNKGFEVIELFEPKTKTDMKNAAIRYSKAIQNDPSAVGLLYYSGHGMQIDGVNYLMPAEANLEVKADVADQCMDLDYIMSVMTSAGNQLNIIVLDACRNNPFRAFTRATDKGLSMVNAPKGSYIVYSTKPGSVAADGSGRNGLFTSKLLKYLNEPGLNIEQVFKKVAGDVSADSHDKQRPWISSDFTGDFYFTPK